MQKSSSETKIIVSALAASKIKMLTDSVHTEWSGLLAIKKIMNKKIVDAFFVEDIYVGAQTNTGAHTEMDSNTCAQLMFDAIDNGHNLLGWVHSHAMMDVFWSGEDDRNINSLLNECLVSIVVNRAGKWLGRVDIAQPVRAKFDNVTIKIAPPDGYRVALLKQDGTIIKELTNANYDNIGPAALAELYMTEQIKEWCKEKLELFKTQQMLSYYGGNHHYSSKRGNNMRDYKPLNYSELFANDQDFDWISDYLTKELVVPPFSKEDF